jgi:hypothetical protein
MSLTFIKKKAAPLAVIKGGKYDGDKLYLSDKVPEDDGKTFEKIHLTDGVFQPVVNTTKEREIGMIVGASGSGKSTYVRKYCMEYKKSYPKRDIFMFSNLTEDKSLDDVGIKRIIIGENLLNEPLSVEDFSDSLVLFDDTDVIRDKYIKEAVYQIMNEILETGRHHKVSAIVTNHLATGPLLKRILNEAHWFVYFPHGATRSTKYVLEAYVGVDKKDVAKIKSCRSRWACVFKNYPSCVVTEKHCFMLTSDD